MSVSHRALARPLILALIAAMAIAALPAGSALAYSPAPTNVWINEIHYDNTGADAGETVEIAGPAGTALTGWSLVEYNGNDGASYATVALSGTIPDQQNGMGTRSFGAFGLQNGSPDGIALVDDATVVQFLSYEGVFTATNGAASGLTSTDIGVAENGSGLVGNSLRLTGTGSTYQAFTWNAEAASSFGSPNPGQTFERPGDAAPRVTASSPADGASNVAANATLSVTFSESVTLADATIILTCDDEGVPVQVQAGPATTFELVYTPPLPDGASCAITVSATGVSDVDTADPPDNMLVDASIDFTVVASDPCAGAFTPIPEIQGSGTVSPFVGGPNKTTEGVVTALFPNLRGFTILDLAGDDDVATSDGIFVFRGPAYGTNTPSVGDDLRLTGRVTEFQNQTEIDLLSELIECGTATPPDPVEITLPETVNGDLERFEGTLVTIPQTLTAQQNFFQGRFGQVTLASGGRLDNPTDQFPADSPERIALADENQRRLIVLDDANSNQNPNPIPYIGEDDTLRAGDTTSGITGLLDEGAINSNTAIRDYRIQPTAPVTFERVNDRTPAPEEVGGWLQVASFNVLNYFNGDGLGGGFPTERGANTSVEFERQRTKIINAIVALDADIVGLMEIENDGSGPTSAIADLVDGLNDATAPGTYALIADPATGVAKPTEPIKTALIYRPAAVTPIGASRSDTDESFERYPVAQTFRLDANGEVVTVLVNHFKSKGCDDATGLDLDQGDGQGCYNATRVAEAEALLGFIDDLQTETGDEDVLVIGDLNAYGQEDPILALLDGGLTDLMVAHEDNPYSYVFDGQSGVLDHGLATESLVDEVTGADHWHINADEPSVIDYNTEFKPQDLYQPHVYRASDHDPVLLGIDLGRCAFEDSGTTRTLLGDCSTDETISVPNGWTLDGDGHAISAFDLDGEHFVGAVVANAGAVAHVTNITVTTNELADVCDAGDDRLRGILLDGAAGSITDSHVIDINQGASGCQEGNGIEARHAPFAPGGVDVAVTISGNEVTGYQKTGILANGSVDATILNNVVTGAGPVDYIAQNGIQVAFGGTGLVRDNTVSGNSYTGPDVACGLLFFEADGVRQQANTLFANERDVCNFGRGGGNAKPN
ncbi:MAG: ExeM/NucH family extracellular endonuclease [Chloroflexota bacterium]|nr:ExeM/NucH family extracellular endonuclease [Chloroflexota bacterium]